MRPGLRQVKIFPETGWVPAVGICLGLYALLIGPQLLVLTLLPPWSGAAPGLWLGFFLLLACYGLALTIVRLNPLLQARRSLRLGLISGSLGFWGGLAWLRYQGGGEADLLALATTANLLVVASLAGSLLADGLKRQAELVLICLVMSLADLCSILRGPTRQIAGELADYYQGGARGRCRSGSCCLLK